MKQNKQTITVYGIYQGVGNNFKPICSCIKEEGKMPLYVWADPIYKYLNDDIAVSTMNGVTDEYADLSIYTILDLKNKALRNDLHQAVNKEIDNNKSNNNLNNIKSMIHNLHDIDTNSLEGRLLAAAISKLIMEYQPNNKPVDIINQLETLADAMYPEQEEEEQDILVPSDQLIERLDAFLDSECSEFEELVYDWELVNEEGDIEVTIKNTDTEVKVRLGFFYCETNDRLELCINDDYYPVSERNLTVKRFWMLVAPILNINI